MGRLRKLALIWGRFEHVGTIAMPDSRIINERSALQQDFMSRTADVFRLAKRDCGLTTPRLAALTGIPAATLVTWASGNTAMPAWAMCALSEHIPDDLMSLLMEPAGKFIGTTDAADDDLDALGCETATFTAELLEAKRDGKVTPRERDRLKDRARRVASRAQAVAA